MAGPRSPAAGTPGGAARRAREGPERAAGQWPGGPGKMGELGAAGEDPGPEIGAEAEGSR